MGTQHHLLINDNVSWWQLVLYPLWVCRSMLKYVLQYLVCVQVLRYLQCECVPAPSSLGLYTWNTSATEKSLLCSLCLKRSALNTHTAMEAALTSSEASSPGAAWHIACRGLWICRQLCCDIVGMEVLARLWQECINALVPLEQKPLIYVFAMRCRCIRTPFLVPAGGFVWQIWFCFHRKRSAVSSKSHLGSISEGEDLVPRQSSAAEWRLGRRQEEV